MRTVADGICSFPEDFAPNEEKSKANQLGKKSILLDSES